MPSSFPKPASKAPTSAAPALPEISLQDEDVQPVKRAFDAIIQRNETGRAARVGGPVEAGNRCVIRRPRTRATQGGCD